MTAAKPGKRGPAPGTPAPRAKVDWDALEPHYKAGKRTITELAREYGCSIAAVSQHAKRHGWTKRRIRQAKKIVERTERAAMAAAARLNAQQEAFAQAVANGGVTLAAAYGAAYGAPNSPSLRACASTLARKPIVAARIAELRNMLAAKVSERVSYGIEEAMKEASAALDLANARGNPGAAVAAVQLRAKLMGLLVEKREVRSGPLDGMRPDELEAMNEAVTAIRRAREPV